MNESAKFISHKAGLQPGALIHVGSKKTERVRISVINYSATNYSAFEHAGPEEFNPSFEEGKVSWINIDGLHDTQPIASLGKSLNLHPLMLEDVLNTRHRPKLEEFDDYLFLSLKMLGLSENGNRIVQEQVSLVLGKNWVISFQEVEGDLFDTIRERIRENKGNLRKMGADYLFYRLIDTIVDNYFIVTEKMSDATEKLEEYVLKTPDNNSLAEIQRLKKQLMNLKRTISPLREAISLMQKDQIQLIRKPTRRYLVDVYEHIIQINDSIEMHRDMVISIMDLYHSGVSNRMNQVMQVLTIIATIFIPLTFIAGIYGMNFDYMPELHWKYGYFGVWGFMLVVFVGMIFYFKRKKWL